MLKFFVTVLIVGCEFNLFTQRRKDNAASLLLCQNDFDTVVSNSFRDYRVSWECRVFNDGSS